MEFRASHMYARISARKVRPVVDLIRGLPVNRALERLDITPKRGAYLVGKVVRSALSNAQQNADVELGKLRVSGAVVDDGPLLGGRLRWRPAARGRVSPIRKRTSHIRITLEDAPAGAEPTTSAAAEQETSDSAEQES